MNKTTILKEYILDYKERYRYFINTENNLRDQYNKIVKTARIRKRKSLFGDTVKSIIYFLN